MPTLPTSTRKVTVMAPVDEVARDLAELTRHAEWATEFFDGPIEAIEGGEYVATVPRMGGRVHMRVDAHIATGAIDMYIAPEAEPFGPALPIRVIPNLDGCDVLFTLSRFPGTPDAQWEDGLRSMDRELQRFADRFGG